MGLFDPNQFWCGFREREQRDCSTEAAGSGGGTWASGSRLVATTEL